MANSDPDLPAADSHDSESQSVQEGAVREDSVQEDSVQDDMGQEYSVRDRRVQGTDHVSQTSSSRSFSVQEDSMQDDMGQEYSVRDRRVQVKDHVSQTSSFRSFSVQQDSMQDDMGQEYSVRDKRVQVTNHVSQTSSSRSFTRWVVLGDMSRKLGTPSNSTMGTSSSDQTMDISRTMSMDIRSSFLKAVKLEDALERFGAHWSGKVSGGFGASETSDCELSVTTDSIDDFISHDWHTNGVLKFMALCFTYNSRPAMLAAVASSACCGIAESFANELRLISGPAGMVAGEVYESYATGYFGLLVGMMGFCAVLLFWQRLRVFLRRRSTKVFVDKLCIHQSDTELKALGILSLGAFLKHSDRMVVLWSPCHITRLWCMYEIATWIHLNRGFEEMVFVPVSLVAFIITIMVDMTMVLFFLCWAARLRDVDWAIAAVSATSVAIIMPTYLVLRFIRDLREIKEQVATFSIRNTKCFCCSCDHKMPGTGEDILCDRALIEATLQTWFQLSADDEPDSHLRYFERQFREEIGKRVLSKVGGSRITYEKVLAASTPVWCYYMDRLFVLQELSYPAAIRLIIRWVVQIFVVYPGLCRMCLMLVSRTDGRFADHHKLLALYLTALMVICTLLMVEGILEYSIMLESPWLQLGSSLFLTILCVAMFYNVTPADLAGFLPELRQAQEVAPTEAEKKNERSIDSLNEPQNRVDVTVVDSDSCDIWSELSC